MVWYAQLRPCSNSHGRVIYTRREFPKITRVLKTREEFNMAERVEENDNSGLDAEAPDCGTEDIPTPLERKGG